MLRLLLLAIFYLAQIVRGTSTNTIDHSCPPPFDGTTTRSIWSILGSCALTLLICVWHTIHFDFPCTPIVWVDNPVLLVPLSFFTPEMVVTIASRQRWEAQDNVNRFREKGYDWSMTHSFFAEMGGFVYRNANGELERICSLRFLDLCEKNEIANPVVTVKNINDRSKSDVFGKAILALQLLWFMLQVVVRGLTPGLVITLVELNTLCLAAISLLVLFLWWYKPLRPECPHIFYSPQDVKKDPQMPSSLSRAWKSQDNYLDVLKAWLLTRIWGPRKDRRVHSESHHLADRFTTGSIAIASLCVTWMVLGGLHLVAWNIVFPTETEKTLWRVASLVLTGTPLVFFGGRMASEFQTVKQKWEDTFSSIGKLLAILGITSRVLLVALMLASLHSLPCTAYLTVSWTMYVPHL